MVHNTNSDICPKGPNNSVNISKPDRMSNVILRLISISASSHSWYLSPAFPGHKVASDVSSEGVKQVKLTESMS